MRPGRVDATRPTNRRDDGHVRAEAEVARAWEQGPHARSARGCDRGESTQRGRQIGATMVMCVRRPRWREPGAPRAKRKGMRPGRVDATRPTNRRDDGHVRAEAEVARAWGPTREAQGDATGASRRNEADKSARRWSCACGGRGRRKPGRRPSSGQQRGQLRKRRNDPIRRRPVTIHWRARPVDPEGGEAKRLRADRVPAVRRHEADARGWKVQSVDG